MIFKLAKLVLFFQGGYYLVTGLWSLISVESFSVFTQYRGDFFLKQTAGLLFSIIGGIFLYFASKNILVKELSIFALLNVLGVMLIEAYYVPKVGNPFPFWLDFGLEAVIGTLILINLIILYLKK
jgi:hypothetical protein